MRNFLLSVLLMTIAAGCDVRPHECYSSVEQQ